MAQQMPPELADLHPQPDLTGGRGYADDAKPVRWTRLANRLAQKIQRQLEAVEKYIDQNALFDKVVASPEEETLRLAMMRTSDWEEALRLHGVEKVAAMRRSLAQGLVKYPQVMAMAQQQVRGGGM